MDVGCGLGREAFALTDLGFAVTGIDLSQEVVRRVVSLSAQRGYDIPFMNYDGCTLPFGDGSFDVVVIWAQTFGLIYGDTYKRAFLQECSRVLEPRGLLSFSGHDYVFEMEHYKNCMKDGRFYPYAGTALYWETFHASQLASYAENAGFSVILCEKGEIYKPEDGTILHCLCRKNT